MTILPRWTLRGWGIFNDHGGNDMPKNILKTGGLIILSFLLFSCASKAPALNRSEADSAYDSDAGYTSNRRSSQDAATEERMITYSVSLELSVKDTEETKKILLEQVETNKGFVVRESDNYITARIPAENMDAFLVKSRTLGKIENESKTGTDITDQYRDNVIRLENLKTVRAKYLALLEKANTVTDILSIEKELERVNTQIEIMEGRIQYAEASVAYSSITVRFKEKAKPGPVGWIFYGLYRGVKWLFIWN
jgi:hypothetical protein